MKSVKDISTATGKKASRHAIDLTGKRFGRLVVLARHGQATNGNAQWLCQCDCGNQVVTDGYRLRRGDTRSCGCLRREESAIRASQNERFLAQQSGGESLHNEEGIYYSSLVLSKRNKSGCIGVSYNRRTGQWFARLMVKGKYVLLTSCATYEEAVIQRKAAERKYFGKEISADVGKSPRRCDSVS